MGHLLPVFVLLIVCSDLLQASRFFHLKEKTLIVEFDRKKTNSWETVTLECNITAHSDATTDSNKIQWSKADRTGKTLTVKVSEPPDAQNYTCALEGEIIDYTHVVLQEVNQEFLHHGILKVKHPISCMIKNYSGHFTCSWNGTAHDNPDFFFEAFGNDGPLPCGDIEKHTVEGNAIPSYTVHCHDANTCHYSEDPSIAVELHVLTKKGYEQHKKFFTLRNIIKPDPPQDLRMENKNNDLSLHWKYPKTWCNAHSFYGLVFNVKVELNSPDDEENYLNVDNTSLSLDLDLEDVTQFCVQARDMYHVNSYWSNWSCANQSKKENTKKRKHNKDKNKKKHKSGKTKRHKKT